MTFEIPYFRTFTLALEPIILTLSEISLNKAKIAKWADTYSVFQKAILGHHFELSAHFAIFALSKSVLLVEIFPTKNSVPITKKNYTLPRAILLYSLKPKKFPHFSFFLQIFISLE